MVQSKNNYELMFVYVFMFRNIYYMAMRKQYLNKGEYFCLFVNCGMKIYMYKYTYKYDNLKY